MVGTRDSGAFARIPYLLGGFMLLPYVLWVVLTLVVFPGVENGFDSVVSLSMFAVSVPLVIWFFLCSLSFLANSMAGDDEFARPRFALARRLIPLLPAATLALAAGAVGFLLNEGVSPALATLPAAAGVLIAWGIRRGERARATDRPVATVVTPAEPEPASPALGRWQRQRLVAWAVAAGATVVLVLLVFGGQGLAALALLATAAAFVAMVGLTG